ncbi:MAG: malto-oligosyltrehalose trehalohydrolase [Bryobacteraceae bacterium]
MILDAGARYLGRNTCRFRVWAPSAEAVGLRLLEPHQALHAMTPLGDGIFELTLEGVSPGTLYGYRLPSGVERPDPASALQPRGVHGPSAVVDPGFAWSDREWKGLDQDKYILYEVHTGAYTAEGTFDAIVPYLDDLADLGITAIELMPVAAFPGSRNWGYDGAFPYAVQASYGGPSGLKRFVNACHARGLAVALDVVYNHLGPEGNYLSEFGPYFNPLHQTPWGAALNFDAAGSETVRAYFIENALRWVNEFHIDALRLDAIHAIIDDSPTHILQELSGRLQGRALLMAESDLNQVRVIQPPPHGLGMNAQWSDDFHHALHVTLTAETNGYYGDYSGFPDLVEAWAEGFVYAGQYCPHRRRHHGTSSAQVEPSRLIVFSQNHDQAGNRFLGERLAHLTDFESAKLAAATVILSPYLPLLFMGEEYGETAPFQYFVSHEDADLIEAVRHGRREEFGHFAFDGEVPDPQSEATFARSKLNHKHGTLRQFYRELLWLRRRQPALAELKRSQMELAAFPDEQVLTVTRRSAAGPEIRVIFNFNRSFASLASVVPGGDWSTLLDSAERIWEGPGSEYPNSLSPRSVVVIASKTETT